MWTVEEFFFELRQDAARRVVFVEGNRDLAFWKRLVPVLERGDTVFYPISMIQMSGKAGGERGRLMSCAALFNDSEYSSRIRLFADADFDRILENAVPDGVVLTDGRDLEAYAMHSACIEKFCVQGLALNECDPDSLLKKAIELSRPVATLRVFSERSKCRLPFKRTLRDGLGRFTVQEEGELKVDVRRLTSVLLQNAQISLARLNDFLDGFGGETEKIKGWPDQQVIHGKDFCLALGLLLELEESVVEACLFLSVEKDYLLTFPNIMLVVNWVRGSGNA